MRSLTLTVVLQPSAQDARGGVVRLHLEALTALGLRAGDPVVMSAARTTGALAAFAPPGTPTQHLLVDALVLRNLGVDAGGTVTVTAGDVPSADAVLCRGPHQVLTTVPPADLRLALLGRVVTAGDEVALGGGVPAVVGVASAEPAGPARVTMATRVGWADGPATAGSATPLPGSGQAPRGIDDLPGLEHPYRALWEWLDLGFSGSDLLHRLGTTPSMGVLLSGPAGSGKAALVQAVAAELGASVHPLWAPRLAALEPAAAAELLRRALTDAAARPPAVVLLEDVEALAPRDGTRLTPVVVEAVQAAVGRAAVVCTTARPESVATALRAPGVLDHELRLALPDRAVRARVLGVLTRTVPLAEDVRLDDVAGRTPGYVAADLLALVREAGLRAAQRHRAAGDPQDPTVAAEDFAAALEVVRPTSMAESTLEVAGLTLDDVGDMATVKEALTEAVLWPLRYPDTYARLGVSPPRGLLLYGPPGCGKTFLVKAVAGSGQVNVLSVKGAELLTKWVGESERAVRELFRRAREAAPALVFLDEVDALAPPRGRSTDGGTTDRVVAALLTELDGIESLRDVTVVGATNRPELIDAALLRPGRLERLVFVPPPDAEARAAILRAAAKGVPLADDVDLDAVAARTDRYSSADCAALVREAAMVAMRESLEAGTVTTAHVEAALARVQPSLRPEQVAALEAFAAARQQA